MYEFGILASRDLDMRSLEEEMLPCSMPGRFAVSALRLQCVTVQFAVCYMVVGLGAKHERTYSCSRIWASSFGH